MGLLLITVVEIVEVLIPKPMPIVVGIGFRELMVVSLSHDPELDSGLKVVSLSHDPGLAPGLKC